MLDFKLSALLVFTTSFFPFSMKGERAAILNQNGEEHYFEVSKENTIEEILQNTESLAPEQLVIQLKDDYYYDAKKHGGPLDHPRNYHRELTQNERNDIAYIVKTLAYHSLFTIALHRSSLEAAGDRIDHIHPLRFLHTVFADEELKVCMRNIRTRGWIWNDFIAGLRESLTTESSFSNIRTEYVQDFSTKVGIDSSLIFPSVQNKNWNELVEVLINKVPRKGDHGRYDS